MKSLLQISEVPEYLRFNRYILHGYRPLTNVKGCLSSVLAWHNQTVDVFTHALPLIYVLFIMNEWAPWTLTSHPWLARAHALSLVAPFIGSITYHTLMSHEGGKKSYTRLLKFDMFGVWLTQTLGALPGMYTTIQCSPPPLKLLSLTFYTLSSLYGLYLALTSPTVVGRMAAFTTQFASRVLFLLIRTAGFGNQATILRAVTMDAVGITAGLINMFRVPEKWFPGKLDYIGNSHQIMHVLVLGSVYHMHVCTLADLDYLDHTTC